MTTMKSCFIIIALALVLAYGSTSASADTCTFEIQVQTGRRENAGTDARISLDVSAATGPGLHIPSLKAWGGQASHDYFERGHLDRFRGKGPCLSGTPCAAVISSNGKGNKPGWYVNYITVTQLPHGGKPSLTRRFDFGLWLSPPRQLAAVYYDCSYPAKRP